MTTSFPSDAGLPSQVRTYERASSVVFLKTTEPFGGLSNMAAGFPVVLCGRPIGTVEALYQACRFPSQPQVQLLILDQASPMAAKMKSKPYRVDTRSDWERIKVGVMRWCLKVKLTQNWEAFSQLLLSTGDKPIVEESSRDPFWGAKPMPDGSLVGMNVLGRLLMELRESVKTGGRDRVSLVPPPEVPNFRLLEQAIGEVKAADGDVPAARYLRMAATVRSDKAQRVRGHLSAGQRTLSDWLLPADED